MCQFPFPSSSKCLIALQLCAYKAFQGIHVCYEQGWLCLAQKWQRATPRFLTFLRGPAMNGLRMLVHAHNDLSSRHGTHFISLHSWDNLHYLVMLKARDVFLRSQCLHDI